MKSTSRLRKHLGIGLGILLLHASAFAQVPLQEKVLGSDSDGGDQFGSSVAIQGDRAVIGAYLAGPSFAIREGAVFVFENGSGGWQESAKLVSPAPALTENFGESVALDGDRILVGAYGHRLPLPLKGVVGTAYLYKLEATGWQLETELVHGDPSDKQQYGRAVAIDGDTIVVGAEFDASPFGYGSGSAYIWERIGGVWVEVAKLTSAKAGIDARFGTQVAIEGGRVFVSAPSQSPVGAVYVYEKVGGAWTEVAELNPSGTVGSGGGGFGLSMAVAQDVVLVGAEFADVGGWDRGYSYVFEHGPSGWTQTQELAPAVPLNAARFGHATAVSRNGELTLAVGAFRENAIGPGGIGVGAGAIHRFERQGSSWHEVGLHTALDAYDDLVLGFDVAFDNGVLLGGAPGDTTLGVGLGKGAGAAYFERVWTLVSSATELSESTGGTVTFDMELGAPHAGNGYLLLASASGFWPGLSVGGHGLLLNPDTLTSAMLGLVGSPLALGYLGILGPKGDGQAQLLAPAGLGLALIGLDFHHMAVLFELATGSVLGSTNTVQLTIIP